MKLSVSLPDDVVDYLDEQKKTGAFPSRSSAVRAAVILLRQSSMTDSYASAWDEWDEWEQAGEDAVGERRRRRAARAMIARGQIHLAALDPAIGSEQGKVRPVIVVSSNAANDSANRRGRGVVTVVPLTTNVRAVYPFQAYLSKDQTGLPANSKAQAEQVCSISTDRLVRQIATLSRELMAQVDSAVRLHLSL